MGISCALFWFFFPIFNSFASIEYTITCDRVDVGDVYVERTNPIDNRTGTDDLIQDIPVLRQFSPDIRVNLRPNSRLDLREVEERIMNQYVEAGFQNQKTCVIPVSVPTGSAQVLEIQWTEILSQGRIEEGRQGGGDVLGDYSIITDLRCEVTGIIQDDGGEDEETPLSQTVAFSAARPEAVVLTSFELLSQPRYPDGNEPLVLGEVSAGERVTVLDVDDLARAWFRVLWFDEQTGTPIYGWVQADSVDYSIRITNPIPAPPGCAVPIISVDSVDDVWSSTVQGKVMVVADLVRQTRDGDYPRSWFAVTRSGRILRDRMRTVFSHGYFLMEYATIALDVRPGNVVGFDLMSVNDATLEAVSFYGIIYHIPDGCGN